MYIKTTEISHRVAAAVMELCKHVFDISSDTGNHTKGKVRLRQTQADEKHTYASIILSGTSRRLGITFGSLPFYLFISEHKYQIHYIQNHFTLFPDSMSLPRHFFLLSFFTYCNLPNFLEKSCDILGGVALCVSYSIICGLTQEGIKKKKKRIRVPPASRSTRNISMKEEHKDDKTTRGERKETKG